MVKKNKIVSKRKSKTIQRGKGYRLALGKTVGGRAEVEKYEFKQEGGSKKQNNNKKKSRKKNKLPKQRGGDILVQGQPSYGCGMHPGMTRFGMPGYGMMGMGGMMPGMMGMGGMMPGMMMGRGMYGMMPGMMGMRGMMPGMMGMRGMMPGMMGMRGMMPGMMGGMGMMGGQLMCGDKNWDGRDDCTGMPIRMRYNIGGRNMYMPMTMGTVPPAVGGGEKKIRTQTKNSKA